MGIEQEAVVRVRLDLEDAKRQLEQLKAEQKKSADDAAKSVAEGRPAQKRPPVQTGPGDHKKAVRPSGDSDHGDDSERSIRDKIRALRLKNQDSGPISNALERGGRFLNKFDSLGDAPKAAGAYAAAYVVASTVSKAGPVAETLFEGLANLKPGDPVTKQLKHDLEALRGAFVQLESKVGAIISAPQKALDFTNRMAQIGVVPDYTHYQYVNYELDSAQTQLDKQFDQFKARLAARTFGSFMRSSFERWIGS